MTDPSRGASRAAGTEPSRGRSRATAPAAAGRRRPRRRDAAPEPPWGAFPLVELCVLSAIALGAVGLVVGGRAGNVLLIGGVAIGSIAGLEVAVREHVAGYRSHTVLLSAALAVAAMALLAFAGVSRTATGPVAVGVFLVAFAGWRTLFKRRSGGVGVKVR